MSGEAMNFDAATFAGIIVVLIVLGFLVFTVRGVERRSDQKIRAVARQATLINQSELARELCRVVHKRYPDACPGLDFTIREDEQGVHISAWYMNSPKPDRDRMSGKA